MATMTIEDYKKMYEAARAAGDAAGMQAANDGANAIRASMGVAPEYATEDIAKAAAQASGYTPINSYAAQDINKDAYDSEAVKQQRYISANPSAVQTQSADEKYAKYGGVIDSTVRTGYYTQDAAAAQAAADKYGVNVTPATYNGQSGWYLVDSAQRTAQAGTSGADEGLLNDYDYAIVQKLKQDFADAQAQYNAAVAAGNTAAAAAARQAMDSAHLEAERIRAGYNYSGGQDGSMYIDYYMNALGGNMPANTQQTRDLLDAKGISYGSSGGSGVIGGSSGGSGGSYGGIGIGSGLTVPGGSDLTGMVEDYSSYLEQMYAARKAAALAELDAAYQSNLNALNRAEQGIGEQYQTARNNTAGASEVSKRNFAEYAAASGLNSGTGGQAELARSVTLQNNLNSINTAEADTISDLQLQRANAETQYNNAIAQAQATGDYELASALYQEKVRVQTALLEMEIEEQKYALQKYQLEYQAQRDQVGDQQWASELGFQQQKYGDSLALQQQEYADSLAQSRNQTLAEYGEIYLQNGIMPSAEMLSAMGITEADAQRYIAALQAQQAAQTVGGTESSGAGTSSGKTMTLATAKQAANSGVFNDRVLSVLRANGYTDDMLEAIYGYKPVPNGSDSSTGSGAGMNDAYFAAAMRSIAGALASGKADSAQEAINQIWDKLSEAQKASVNSLIASYGGTLK